MRIVILKVDAKAAYRRITHDSITSLRSCTAIGDIGYMAIRHTFGGRINVYNWCTVSEMFADTANDLLNCPEWDPAVTKSYQADDIPPEENVDDDVPFAPAAPLALRPFPSPNGQVDMFVDDGHTVCLSRPGIQRGDVALMTAMDAMARPVSP